MTHSENGHMKEGFLPRSVTGYMIFDKVVDVLKRKIGSNEA